LVQESLRPLQAQVEASQETMGVRSLMGVLGFPWERASNEEGKTFIGSSLPPRQWYRLLSFWAPGYEWAPLVPGFCVRLTRGLVPKCLLMQPANTSTLCGELLEHCCSKEQVQVQEE